MKSSPGTHIHVEVVAQWQGRLEKAEENKQKTSRKLMKQ
jgi:hypothetical protein